jgi:ribosome biogenesis protein Nip4
MRVAVSVGREQLGSLGVCFGKFTKTGKFTLHITALDYLAQYAKVRSNDTGRFFFLMDFFISLAQDLDQTQRRNALFIR